MNRQSFTRVGLTLTAVVVVNCSLLVAEESTIDFNRDVRPLLIQHCTRCHGGVKQAGGVSYIYRQKVLGEGESGETIVVPGDPDSSEFVRRITSDDESERMPPPEESPEGLTDDEIKRLTEWVRQGAPWQEHWSFTKPTPQELPEVSGSQWCLTRVDRFILARLEAEGLRPSPEADRLQWLRRVTFDLTGLPPSLAEMEAFRADQAEDAHEKVVDRLLRSDSFGERWAALWLDLARYADSMGFERDPGRTIWPYRDWVIRAFNADMPFDEFTIKQLAGDLLPDATLDDFVATAMHRNSQTNTEGGTDDEEFRIAAMIDRVNTTWTVWQGFTFGCVQCHSHPYEPFRHEEYYRFAAFFNNVADCDLTDEYPTLRVPADPRNNARVLQLRQEKEQISRAIMQPFQQLAGDVAWRGVRYGAVESNKPRAELGVRQFAGVDEVFAAGTVGQQSVYDVELVPQSEPAGPVAIIHAVRIDVPLLEGDDAANPSPAFVVTGVKLKKSSEDHQEAIPIGLIVADQDEEMFWPPERWGAFPNQFHDRWAVVIPNEPIHLTAGEKLVVTLEQQQGRDGAAPPVLRRFRLSTNDDERWQQVLDTPKHGERLATRARVVEQLQQIEGIEMPVLLERVGFPRQAAVFHRGNWLDKTERVGPDVPGLLPPLSDGAARNRLTLAHWLVSPDNPLTSRVTVNRLWAALFGVGLVETQEDFASTGTPPSHPSLLDDLAVRFTTEHGWRVKSLLRELVLSAAYRQDAKTSAQLLDRDPRNRLLSRGPRNRLTAEMVRDHALSVSGLLSPKMYGPPVMPPQPEGTWQTVYSNAKWITSEGDGRYRRALYTYWRRSSPYPSLMTFDASARQVCSPRRVVTNTPLQALVSMNDPVYIEASQAFARRMKQSGDEPRTWIEHGLQLATSRPATEADVSSLVRLYEDARDNYRQRPDDAQHLAETPEDAALALVANTILNLDNSLTK